MLSIFAKKTNRYMARHTTGVIYIVKLL